METLKEKQKQFVANLPATTEEDLEFAQRAFRSYCAPDSHICAAWFIARTGAGQALTSNHSIAGGGKETAEEITGIKPFDFSAAVEEGGEEWAIEKRNDYWTDLEQAFIVDGIEYGFAFSEDDTYFVQYADNE